MDVETDLVPRRVNGRMWTPGQSGNPAGRPIGARGRFSQQFVEDMRASWERHGATVMDRVAAEYPDRYLGIAAHLVPKEVTATIEASHGGLDPADYAILQAIKESLPAANSESPQAILEFVGMRCGHTLPR
jgi:hypothetical protein